MEMAGVNTTLLSLWKVDDESTTEGTITIYQELIKSNDISNSLKTA